MAPLTGLPTAAAVAARPAVAVPILLDATHIPTGLGHADVVYAEWNGGTGIHLVAIFQSQDDASVGPVSGLLPVDAKLLPVLRPVVAAGTTYAKFLKLAQAEKLNIAALGTQSTPYHTAPDGAAYVSTSALRALAVKGVLPPASLFPFAGARQPLAAGQKPVTHLNVPASGNPVFAWSFDAAHHRWLGTVGNLRVSATSVVVLETPFKTVNAHFPQGPIVNSAQVFGSGTAYAVSGPVGAVGHWARSGPLKLTDVFAVDNFGMRLTPGPIWVIIAPAGTNWTSR